MRSSITSSVPLRFADRTLDNYEPDTPSQKAALAACREFLDGLYKSLCLIGPPGVGKTHLAAGVFAACKSTLIVGDDFVRRVGHPGLWLNVADALSTMRLEMGLPIYERDVTLALRATGTHEGLVVLDDLGRENATDWTGELVYGVVNARYEAMLPTVVTSNRSIADLRAGPYWTVISRLAEGGRLIALNGVDRRLGR